MRARRRTLAVWTLLAGMSAAWNATAQEAPPPPDPVAVQPPPATPTPVVRFVDETPESHAPTRLSGPTDARTEPTDAGQLVAHLPLGAIVTRLASRGAAVLVELEAPGDLHKTLLGWVPRAALERPAAPPAPAVPPPRLSREAIHELEQRGFGEGGYAVPAGYHLENRVRPVAIIGGAVFGATYGITALVSAFGANKAGLIPVAGPFFLIEGSVGNTGGLLGFLAYAPAVALVLDALAQVTGLLMLTAGLANGPKSYLVRDRVVARVVPMTMGREGYGLGVVGSF
jgi:hypothetical protein